MKTAEQLARSHEFGTDTLDDILYLMKVYAKQVSIQALKDASEKSIEVIYEREKNYSQKQGLVLRNFQTCYATPKQTILQTEIKLP